jgi:methylthioribose-1-phosphate isomerase
MTSFRTIEWVDNRVRLLDQTLLPGVVEYLDCDSVASVAEAIRSLRIRGAPAIGVAAAFGMALCAVESTASTPEALLADLQAAREELSSTRPTAVNLFWALERMMRVALSVKDRSLRGIRERLVQEAQVICDEDIARNRKLGALGAALLPDSVNVLTHCNAGALATAGYGTALGVVRAAVEAGKTVHVYADETRPVWQGARLTAWELQQDNIPVTLLTDNMAAWLMRQGRVDCVIVGADRIAANGDTANKIGTYGLAVVAEHHRVPFYVAAPTSTVDLSLPSGEAIPIEQRGRDEVALPGGLAIAPDGVEVMNPAFDVTPAGLIAAIITETAVVRSPFKKWLKVACAPAQTIQEDTIE